VAIKLVNIPNGYFPKMYYAYNFGEQGKTWG